MWKEETPQEAQSTPQNNPFMWKDEPKQEEPQQTSAFMAGVDTLNRSFGRMAEGVLDLVTWGDVNKALRNYKDKEETAFALTKQNHPDVTGYLQPVTDIAAAVAFGSLGAGAGSTVLAKHAPAVLNKMMAYKAVHPVIANTGLGAGGSAALSYLDYADTQEDRIKKGLLGGALGAVGGGAAYGIGKIASKVINPKKAAIADLAITAKADLGDDAAQKIPELLQPAKELGTTRSPGQAIGGLTRARELELGDNLLGRAKARAVDRIQTEQTLQGVNDVIDQIAPQGTKELKNSLYNNLSSLKVPQNVTEELKSNSILGKQLDALKSGDEVTEATKALPDDSLAKWNIVKKEIDGKLYRDARALDPFNKKGEEALKALLEARSKLVSTLDTQFPEYAAARKEAQKLILRDRYESLLLKKGAKAGKANNLDIDETWQTLFPNKETQKIFIQDVADAGGNPKQAENILTALDQLRQSPIKRIYSRASESIAVPGSKVGFLQKSLDTLTNGRYKKALLELTLNGDKWAEDIVEALKNPKEKMVNLLLKVTGKGALRAGNVEAGRLLTDQQ